jgi:transposase
MTIHPGSIGIDVSKSTLDVFDGLRGARRLNNDADGVHALLESLAGRDAFVTFEATGRLDRRLRDALQAAGIRFARVNPERARSFARALGLLAKTDKVDARMLALMGQKLEMRVEVEADPDRDTLAALTRRRDQLVALRQQERTRATEGEAHWTDSIARVVACLDEEIAGLDRRIKAFIRAQDAIKRRATLLRSVPGLGPVSVAVLIGLMPELGHLTSKAAAALAGLAPFNRDSGAFKGQRSIQGGRKRIRDALYMAANAAIKSNSRFRTFHAALIARGKAFKQALVAVARKIVVTANAVLRDQAVFRA